MSDHLCEQCRDGVRGACGEQDCQCQEQACKDWRATVERLHKIAEEAGRAAGRFVDEMIVQIIQAKPRAVELSPFPALSDPCRYECPHCHGALFAAKQAHSLMCPACPGWAMICTPIEQPREEGA
jgi:hypothetical protein